MEGGVDDNLFLEQFKLKRMIKKLEGARGNGTSLITLIIPAGKKISDFTTLITEEIGKGENIKDRVNRQSVITALNSVKEKLKCYTRTPKNGLALFCGNGVLEGHHNERKIMIAVEPFKEINVKIYNCGDSFDVAPLKSLLVASERYGFVIVDGNGALFGVLQGDTRTVVNHFTVDLPKKHGKGGQSSNRFARLRTEKRLIYTKKICEETTKAFVTDSRPNVDGLVLAGYADFKNNVVDNQFFDQRLKPIVLKVVDISYGGDAGFVQAINLAQDCFRNVRLVQEQRVIDRFYSQVTFDTGKFCSGVEHTMRNLHDKLVEALIVFDQLDYQIVELRLKTPPKAGVALPNEKRHLKLKEVEGKTVWVERTTGTEYVIVDYEPLIDWIGENYTTFNCELHLVTDKSPQGNQFVKGFGGIGALLKCKTELTQLYFSESEKSDDDGEWI